MAILKKKGKKPRVALDDGHGMSTPGKRTPLFPSSSGMKSETGLFMHENEFNRKVVDYLKVELIRNGFEVVLTAPGDSDASIGSRVRVSNNFNADLLLSVHANAITGKWNGAKGVETLSSPKNKKLAMVFQNHLMNGTQQVDRGWKDGLWLGLVKQANAPVILVEAGFMDNLSDAKLLLSDSFRLECAKELAQACCEVFGIKYSAVTSKNSSEKDYPYDKNKGIGTLRILVDKLNTRTSPSLEADNISGSVKLNSVYYVYRQENGLFLISDKDWVSASPKYTAYTPHPVQAYHVIKKGDTLWSIARSNGVTVDYLTRKNPGKTSILVPGVELSL